MKNRANKLFIEAVKSVNEANEELCRPEEDVVSVLVCKKAQLATTNFLKGFLLQNGIEPKNDMTLSELHQECLAINPNFKKIDLSNFDCKTVNLATKDCNDVTKISGCHFTATKLETFLREEKVI